MDYAGPLLISAMLLVGAFLDWRHRILPNWLALAIFATASVSVAATDGLSAIAPNLIHFAIALGLGFALFAVGVLGGGDAKTYSALAMTAPISEGYLLLALTAVATAGLAVIWLLVVRLKAPADTDQDGGEGTDDSEDHKKVPLGVAIAVGGMAYLWWPQLQTTFA